MHMFKAAAAGGVVASALVVTTPAQAQVDFLGLLSGWEAAPVVTASRTGLPDVIFTFLGTGEQTGGAGCTAYLGCELAATTAAFNSDASVRIDTNAEGQYRVNVSGLSLASPGTYSIQYFVDVDGWFSEDQEYRFGDVLTGLDRTGTSDSAVSVTKSIKGVLPDPADPAQDPDGPPDNWTALGPAIGTDGESTFPAFDESVTSFGESTEAPFCGQCTRFLITDTVVLDGTAGNTANSITNTFGLTVPEPTTLALLGAGFAGAGFSARRRKVKK